jgi:hypothetical protein
MKALCALCLAVLMAGCAAAERSPSAPGDKLYQALSTQNSQFVSVIDSRSHKSERQFPLGVPSVDWRHSYSFDTTSVVDTNPATGQTQAALQLGHAYRLPGATIGGMPGGTSPDGRWLVLERYDQSGEDVPSASHFLLLTTSPLAVSARVDLNGFFDFDAVSNDGKRIYLIQYAGTKAYYVRMYDLAAGRLDPQIVFDKSDGTDAMSGLRLSGVASRDGAWLLSAYAREHDSPFVHALSLDGPLAFCIDLPGKGYQEDGAAFQWSLAMSPDGSTLYAVNLSTGDLAQISLQDAPHIARTVHLAVPKSTRGLIQTVEAKEMGANAAFVSEDGHTLVAGGSTGVVWIDTASASVRKRALTDWRIWSIAPSPDGSTIYAVSDGGKVAAISMASGQVQDTFDLGAGQPMALMRVAAS